MSQWDVKRIEIETELEGETALKFDHYQKLVRMGPKNLIARELIIEGMISKGLLPQRFNYTEFVNEERAFKNRKEVKEVKEILEDNSEVIADGTY